MASANCKSNCSESNGFTVFSGANGYMKGFKYCKPCDRGIKIDSFICPCCGGRLRSSPRGRTN